MAKTRPDGSDGGKKIPINLLEQVHCRCQHRRLAFLIGKQGVAQRLIVEMTPSMPGTVWARNNRALTLSGPVRWATVRQVSREV